MHTSQPVTETIILNLKEGINLENVASGASSGGSPAVHEFVQLNNILKAQQGFICQFWGHQVENQNIFVWSIDWKSFEHHAAFINSEEYKSFMAGLSRVFDLEVAAPLMIYSRFTSDAGAALKAPVTEVAFLTLPNDAGEDARTTIENALIPVFSAVTTVGKSSGAAIGWVRETQHAAAPDGKSIALHGVFGYASIEDHMKWRETPEHAQAIEIMEDLGRNLGLGSANIHGRDMFHVKFRAGM